LEGPSRRTSFSSLGGYEGLRSLIGNSFATQIPQTGAGAGPAASMVEAISALQSSGVPLSPVSLALLGCTPGASPKCTGGQYQNASANSNSYLSGFPNVNQSDNGIAKIDYHINARHTLSGVLFVGNYTGV
jgi:hypothetical protein